MELARKSTDSAAYDKIFKGVQQAFRTQAAATPEEERDSTGDADMQAAEGEAAAGAEAIADPNFLDKMGMGKDEGIQKAFADFMALFKAKREAAAASTTPNTSPAPVGESEPKRANTDASGG